MEQVGIEFRDDPAAMERWKAAGAAVDGVRVRMAPELVHKVCATAPSEFAQYSRNPVRNPKSFNQYLAWRFENFNVLSTFGLWHKNWIIRCGIPNGSASIKK